MGKDELFRAFLKAVAADLRPRGYARNGAHFLRRSEAVYWRVWFQRSSSSTAGDPWFYVNWGAGLVALMDERERASLVMDGCILEGRMEHDRRERIFRLRMYESPAAAWAVIRPDLLTILDTIESWRGPAEFLAARAEPMSGMSCRFSAERFRSRLSEKGLI